MDLTKGERSRLSTISAKLSALRGNLESKPIPTESETGPQWYERLSQIKRILGNFDNDVSFVASLMAKEFLMTHHKMRPFDVSQKPQGAPGLDIDQTTEDGQRVIAEIKTTIPYGATDFGASQKKTVRSDFGKLEANGAEHKYFFVTEKRTFQVVTERYLMALRGAALVLLPEALTNKEYILQVSNALDQGLEIGTRRAGSSRPWGQEADSIREHIHEKHVVPARTAGKKQLILRSGDLAKEMGMSWNYANICNAMRGRKIEKLARVRILNREGTAANFYVTYAL